MTNPQEPQFLKSMGNRGSDNPLLSLIRSLKSGGDSKWRVGTMILLGSFLYYSSMIVTFVIMAGLFKWQGESAGYLAIFLFIIGAPIHLLGLLVCVGLIVKLRRRGVILSAVGGMSYIPLALRMMEFF